MTKNLFSYFKTILILLLFIFAFLKSEIKILKDNPLVIGAANLTEREISAKIKQKPKWFSGADIKDLKRSIKTNQNKIDNDISIMKRIISDLVLIKQNLLKYNDIKKIQEQIVEKQSSRLKIKNEMEKDLATVNFKTIFLVIQKDIDLLSSKEKLSSIAEKLITPIAVEDLNSIFISSLTTIKNNAMVYDYLKSIISGEMSVVKKYMTRTLRKDKQFIYLAKVSVSPLKKSIFTANTSLIDTDNEQVLVLNLKKNPSYKKKLKNYGISNKIIAQIEEEMSFVSNTVDNENYIAGANEKKIIAKGNNNIAKIDEEIRSLKIMFARRTEVLKKIIMKDTDIVFDMKEPAKSLKKAISYFSQEIEGLRNEMLLLKENELVFQATKVISEGEPAGDIAKNCLSMVKQLQTSYGKLEQFQEISEVENFMLTSFERGQKQHIFRKIDKIWIYPVPDNNEDFKLAVVAKFKINGTKKLAGKNHHLFDKYKSKYPSPFEDTIFYNKQLNKKKKRLNNLNTNINFDMKNLNHDKKMLRKYNKDYVALKEEKKSLQDKLDLINSCYTQKGIIARSSIIPGWGQFRSDRKVAGTLFSSICVVGASFYYYSYSQSESKHDDYDEVYNSFKSAYGDEKQNLSRKLSAISSDIDDYKKLGNIAIGIVGTAYLLNIFDVIYFTPEDKTVKMISKMPKIMINDNTVKINYTLIW